jgi:hypothetical protein
MLEHAPDDPARSPPAGREPEPVRRGCRQRVALALTRTANGGRLRSGRRICARVRDSDLPTVNLFVLVVAEANKNGEFVVIMVIRSRRSTRFVRARGSIHMPSIRGAAQQPGYLSDPMIKISVAMHRYIRRFAQPALSGIVGPRCDTAPCKPTGDSQCFGPRRCRSCVRHLPHGFNVVDSRLNVRGVTGLRVIDGSIMPTMVSANTNGPIGKRGELPIIQEDAGKWRTPVIEDFDDSDYDPSRRRSNFGTIIDPTAS